MTLYLQHGFGKSSRLVDLPGRPGFSGIVLSPADEDPQALRATARAAEAAGLRVLFDPQTYLYGTGSAAFARNHRAHNLDLTGIHWSQPAEATTEQVEAARRAQAYVLPNGPFLTPTVVLGSFADAWAPLGLQIARTASRAWGRDRTIVSVAFEEAALASSDELETWLNIATTLEVRGFYLVVQRNSTQYPPVAWQPERLANLLSLVYTLGYLNGYEVHWGYADHEGLAALAAGATSVGAGWSFGLRQFSTKKWVPTGGGRPAIVRIPARRIWATIRAVGEADQLTRSPTTAAVLDDPLIRARFPTGDFASLGRSEAQDLFLIDLADHAASIGAQREPADRLDRVQSELGLARELLGVVEKEGVVLDARYLQRVQAISNAVSIFRDREKV
jgi:hypothetical protein